MKKIYAWAGIVAVVLVLSIFARPKTITTPTPEDLFLKNFKFKGDVLRAPPDIAVHIQATPGGFTVRNDYTPNDPGIFVATPGATDFVPLPSSGSEMSTYYRAGSTIYEFEQGVNLQTTAFGNVLPVPREVVGADASTFVPNAILGVAWSAKDKNHVYFKAEADSTIDPATVAPMPGQGSLFKDARHVYRFSETSDPPYIMLPYDPDTFVVAPPSYDYGTNFPSYVGDKNGIYYDGTKVEKADPTTFTIFTTPVINGIKDSGPYYSYAKDKNYVYYAAEVVPGADPTTFEPVVTTFNVSESYGGGRHGILTYYYGKDATHVFEGTTTLPEADPQTFEPLWYPIYEGCGPDVYSKDATHVYYHGKVVEGADAATFVTGDTYARDKNGYWVQGHLDPTITKDPECNYG